MIFRRKLILACCFSVLSIVMSYAQPPGDDPGGEEPQDVPITGIEILIGLGGALGIRKLISAKGNKSSEK